MIYEPPSVTLDNNEQETLMNYMSATNQSYYCSLIFLISTHFDIRSAIQLLNNYNHLISSHEIATSINSHYLPPFLSFPNTRDKNGDFIMCLNVCQSGLLDEKSGAKSRFIQLLNYYIFNTLLFKRILENRIAVSWILDFNGVVVRNEILDVMRFLMELLEFSIPLKTAR